MKVIVPGPLRSYVGNKSEVEAQGATVREILADLNARFPGMRFRMIDEHDGIRQHIRFFVDAEPATLDTKVDPAAEVQIICAISGGAFPSR